MGIEEESRTQSEAGEATQEGRSSPEASPGHGSAEHDAMARYFAQEGEEGQEAASEEDSSAPGRAPKLWGLAPATIEALEAIETFKAGQEPAEEASEEPTEEADESEEALLKSLLADNVVINAEAALLAICIEAIRSGEEFSTETLENMMLAMGMRESWELAELLAEEEAEAEDPEDGLTSDGLPGEDDELDEIDDL